MSTVLTIIAMVAGTLLFTLLILFLLIGLLTWIEKHGRDPIAAAIGWALDFWERR